MHSQRLNHPLTHLHPVGVSEFEGVGGRLLVIFDGHCGLCNRSVRWFLIRDQRDHLRYVPSESPRVAALLARHGISSSSGESTPNTLLVACDPGGPAEQLLVRSEGVLAMLAELPRPWPAIAWVLRWIPRPLRDLGYRLIARLRYRIWGRLENCPLPTPAERARFL